MFREEIVKKYVNNKIEKPTNEVWTNDQYIDFYKGNKKSLHSLLLEINEYFVDNKKIIKKESQLTQRQIGCIQRITKSFIETLYGAYEQDFSHAYYELLDFIFYPGYDLKELSYNEIEIIRMMIAYLESKADEFIMKLDNHPDEYLNRYSIEKYKETLRKKYYYLKVDNNIVGKGWIRKKAHRIPQKGMNIFIEPQFRRKKYGTKFYHILAREITNISIENEWVYLVVKKDDIIAISFLNNILGKNVDKFKIGNRIIFLDTLIEE